MSNSAMQRAIGSIPDALATGLRINQNQQRIDLYEKDAALNREIKGEELIAMRNQRLQQQQEAQRKGIVLNVTDIADQYPEYGHDLMLKYAQQFGFVDANGNTTVGGLEKLHERMDNDPLFQAEYGKRKITYLGTQLQELNAAIANETNEKKLQALTSQRDQTRASLIEARNVQTQIGEYIKKNAQYYTPESQQRALITGDIGQLVRVPEKTSPGKSQSETRAEFIERHGDEFTPESLQKYNQTGDYSVLEPREEAGSWAKDLSQDAREAAAGGATQEEYTQGIAKSEWREQEKEFYDTYNKADDDYRQWNSQLKGVTSAINSVSKAGSGDEMLALVTGYLTKSDSPIDPSLVAETRAALGTATTEEEVEKVREKLVQRLEEQSAAIAEATAQAKSERDYWDSALKEHRKNKPGGAQKQVANDKQVPKFRTEAEAVAAFQAGTIKVGDTINIAGKTDVVR